MPADDYSPAQRQEDQKLAAESRMRSMIAAVAAEDRAQFWDRLGFNVREASGMERLRRVVNAAEMVGINLSDSDSVEDFRSAWKYASDLRHRRQESGNEARKSWIHAGIAAVASGVVAWLAAMFSMKGGPH